MHLHLRLPLIHNQKTLPITCTAKYIVRVTVRDSDTKMKDSMRAILHKFNILLIHLVTYPVCPYIPCSPPSSSTLTPQHLSTLPLYPLMAQGIPPHTPRTPTIHTQHIPISTRLHYLITHQCILPLTHPLNNRTWYHSLKQQTCITYGPLCRTTTPPNTHMHTYIRIVCLHLPQGWAPLMQGLDCILIPPHSQ